MSTEVSTHASGRVPAMILAAICVLVLGSLNNTLRGNPFVGYGHVQTFGGTVTADYNNLPGHNLYLREDGLDQASWTSGVLHTTAQVTVPDGGFPTADGYAEASATMDVDPVSGTMSSFGEAYNGHWIGSEHTPDSHIAYDGPGHGPTHKLTSFGYLSSYAGPFGDARASGYLGNVIHVESATLPAGTSISIAMRSQLSGSFSAGHDAGSSDAEAWRYARLSVRVSSLNNVAPDWRLTGEEGWYRWQNMIPPDGNVLHADDYSMGLAYHGGRGDEPASDTVDYDTGEQLMAANVGDWLYVEAFYDVHFGLPAHGDEWAEWWGEADFTHTMQLDYTPADAWMNQISLVPRQFLIPEPTAVTLLGFLSLACLNRRTGRSCFSRGHGVVKKRGRE